MNNLSRKYTKHQWAENLEYQLFQLLSGFRFTGLINISKSEENDLRKYFQEDYIWWQWDENLGHPVPVHYSQWVPQYDDWYAKNMWPSRVKISKK